MTILDTFLDTTVSTVFHRFDTPQVSSCLLANSVKFSKISKIYGKFRVLALLGPPGSGCTSVRNGQKSVKSVKTAQRPGDWIGFGTALCGSVL